MTALTALADRIMREIGERPQQFAEAVDAHRDVPWPEFLRAWGELRALDLFERDEDGRYHLKKGRARGAIER
jgi:hypothetical protein